MIAVLTVLIAFVGLPREPKHQGKSLTEWITAWLDAMSLAPDEISQKNSAIASNAIVQIGSSGVPWVMKWSRQDQSQTLESIRDRWNGLMPESMQWTESIGARVKADIAAGFLRDHLKERIPEMIQMLHQGNTTAISLLEAQGTNALGAALGLVDSVEQKHRLLGLDLIARCGPSAISIAPDIQERVRRETDPAFNDELLFTLVAISGSESRLIHNAGTRLLAGGLNQSRATGLAAVLRSRLDLGLPYLLQATTNLNQATRIAALASLSLSLNKMKNGDLHWHRSRIEHEAVFCETFFRGDSSIAATNLMALSEEEARKAGLRLAAGRLRDLSSSAGLSRVSKAELLRFVSMLTNDPSKDVVVLANQILAEITARQDKDAR